MKREFVSLMYHNVCSSRGDAAGHGCAELSPSMTLYFVDEARFAAHLDVLSRTARVLTFAELTDAFAAESGEWLRHDANGDRPLVHLTFDDGWRGGVELGGPLLEQHGMQATLFVTTGLIGRPGFLNEAELRELRPTVFHVGSHARTHGFLNEMTTAEIREELQSSRDRLEDILGYAVDSISIPNGAVDERVCGIALETGYRFLFTSQPRRNTPRSGPLRIGRVAVRETTSAEQIARFVAGDFRRESWRRAALDVSRRLLGPARYRRWRMRLLGASPVGGGGGAGAARDMQDLVQSETKSATTPKTDGRVRGEHASCGGG